MEKKTYKTKQKELVLKCLEKQDGRHITAEDIATFLKENGNEIGLATIYRNLDKLVEEGRVIRYKLPDSACACFQVLQNEAGHKAHCHSICTGCGKVGHLECEEIDKIAKHLEDGHGFKLDKYSTVLYGICPKCNEEERCSNTCEK